MLNCGASNIFMPAGRPRTKPTDEQTTSVSFDKETRLAIKRLQLLREERDQQTTMKDLIKEGLALLLAKEGLSPMAAPKPLPNAVIINLSKRLTGGPNEV